jgi:hypothetical protein
MQPRFAATIDAGAVASSSSRSFKALVALGAATPSEACRRAERELARAPRCGCCVSPRVHLTKYVGSTLFFDDDPASLRRALPQAERARWSDRLIAAFIMLYGRARVSLFERS